MAIQFNFVSSMLILVLLSISSVKVQGGGWGGVVDVVAKFGAKAGDQQIEPLLDAWKEACASTSPSKIVIPKGIYFLRSATLDGPYKVPIQLQIKGTVKAPADPELKISNCLAEEFSTAREPLLIKGKVAKVMIIVFHANVLGCKNITFERFTVSAPDESPNTDGIHIGRSDGVNVLNLEIKTGDDCVSIADGSKNLVINGKNYTMTNTSNGVRIKRPGAEPGTCLNIHFEDITVTNVNSPIIIDQKYFPWNKRKINVCTIYQNQSKVKLSNICFKNIHDTSARLEVVKIICSATLPCENVELADVEITHSGPTGPAVSQCLNVKPKVSGKQNPAACSAPIPAKPTPTT
ncbi:hypothetical protein ES288_A02G133000v1 [Gossypium darwinii]|uniref:Pectate lyase superfamily protein domain-containing protein n=1 Tax=Gossypium darwinii TaxID=34276 RepID=A0A5D2HDW3_GOSDA|nr:hypothetical protein ES288_A02G133000v1 [Gossypium darwinii]